MSITPDLAALFQRDLTRLLQQIQAFADDGVLWQCPPGISNSCGNLTLHLEGNLREYVGRVLGGVPYRRLREQEFVLKEVPLPMLIARVEHLISLVPKVIRQLPEDRLEAAFPDSPMSSAISTRQFLFHLYGHLSYHLGQIDYLRRLLTSGTAIAYASL